MGSDLWWAERDRIESDGPKAIVQRDKIQAAMERWTAMQGHDCCHYHPDIFREIAEILGMSIPEATLPPRPEFEAGCKRFQDEIYKGKSS